MVSKQCRLLSNFGGLEGAMTPDATLELVKLLTPAGSLAVVAGILAYRSPQIVREIFAGVGSLILTIEKVRREKATRTLPGRAKRPLPSEDNRQDLAA
jgi:hypothetical protein